MQTVIIHGQSHKGSTYHIARQLSDKLGGETKEFFLPRDFGSFCTGCTNCFIKSEILCPHYEKLKPITEAMNKADIIILASPVYVYHATGAMKAFLDHYGYRWLVHRPEEEYFHKQAVCISTAAGAGMKSTNKDMADSMFFWGVAKTYRYGIRVMAVSWDGVSDKLKSRIEKKTTSLAGRLRRNYGKIKPSLKTKIFFHAMRMLNQHGGLSKTDSEYWKSKGWTGKNRPWKLHM